MVPEAFVKLVEEMKGKDTVTTLCSLFEVVRSIYYRWKKSALPEEKELRMLEQEFQRLRVQNKFRCGYRKIT